MNRYAFYVQEVPNGWRAMVRFAADGHPKPIMAKGGKPEVYPTEQEAYRGLLSAVKEYFNGRYLREGVTLSTGRSEAEKQFGSIFRNGREIKIERKEKAA